MWYALTRYSFDSEKPIAGPFKTEEEAWDFIESQADEEYRIDTEENGWETRMFKDKENGEITLIDYFVSHKDTTEFFIFEIDNTKLI